MLVDDVLETEKEPEKLTANINQSKESGEVSEGSSKAEEKKA